MTTPTPEQMAKFAELAEFFAADPLDPELVTYSYEDDEGSVFIKHPLVFSIWHNESLNRMCNAQLKGKREACDKALDEGDWPHYVWLHERPYRLDAFLAVEWQMSDAEYWALLGDVWCDSENIREHPEEWPELLHADRGDRRLIMRDDEREEFDALPDTLTIWQGCTDQRDDGWSWTLDEGKAQWFANRFAMFEKAEPRLRKATCRKSDVVAYLTRRGESEILVDPELVDEDES